ncbi:MAG: hypothetical protein ABSB86_02720 [Bryobacteraceae bacterium]
MIYDPAKFYVWRAPGTLFSIHLSLDVINRLNQARAQCEGDICAVLLGYSMVSPQQASFVDDFALLPGSWDLTGGAYSKDLEETRADIVRKLAGGAENGHHAIGFCRWQQEGPLELTGADFAAAQRFFAEADNILLLIRSQSYQIGEAALFYWDEGKLQVPEAFSHFPFDVGKLTAFEGEPAPRERRTAAEPPPPTPRSWSQSSGEPIRWLRLLTLSGILSIGIAAAQLALVHNRPAAAQPQTPAAIESAPILGLKATWLGKQLQIRWNHDAKAIPHATRGQMRITDGGQTEVIEFEQRQLQDGAVSYTPFTNDVNIRLEIGGPDGGGTTESVRVVAIP